MHPAARFACIARFVVLALVGVAFAAWSGHAAAAKRKAGQASAVSQLRGVNLTPNRAYMVGPYGFSAEDNSREMQSACQLGADVVRLFVSVPDLEPNPGQVDGEYASRLDSLMRDAAQCGIKVIMSMGGTPKWDSSAPATEKFWMKYPPLDNGAEYHRIVGWALQRWQDLYAVEVGNEPNLPSFWAGTPTQYALLVNAAVAARRETGSHTLILAGALAQGATDYLYALYAAGMRGQDGISLHPYSIRCAAQQCDALLNPSPGSSPFRQAITRIHQTMTRNGDSSRLYLTEFGFSSCPSAPACVSDAVQAAWMAKSIRIAACYPYVAALTGFTLRDISVPATWDATSWHFHFGLMGSDFSPKPAFGAVSGAFRSLSAMEAGVRSRSAKRSRAKGATKASIPSSFMCTRLIGGSAKAKAKRG